MTELLPNCFTCLEKIEAAYVDDKESDDAIYTVWVGGTEVNDYLLTLSDAQDLADRYKSDGYDDVCIQNTLL